MDKNNSTSCSKYQDMIYSCFSDNLTEEQIEKLENHISSCRICRNEFEQIRTMLSSIGQIQDNPLPVGFETALHMKLIKASEEICDKNTHKFKYFCKNFITAGKWKVAAPALAAVVLLVGVFASGLFGDFIHTDDDIVSDDIRTSQNVKNKNSSSNELKTKNRAGSSQLPRATLKPRTSAMPTAKPSASRATSKPTLRPVPRNYGVRSGINAGTFPAAPSGGTAADKFVYSAPQYPAAVPTQEKIYPKTEVNDNASQNILSIEEEPLNDNNETVTSTPVPRAVGGQIDPAAEAAVPMLANDEGTPDSGAGVSMMNDGAVPYAEDEASNDINTVYFVHHESPGDLIGEYGFSDFTIDTDGDYHVLMSYKEFEEFLKYAEENSMPLKWLNDGNNGIVEIVITKSEIKDEEAIID